MKEIYAWVPWFQELARKIADGGEAYLINRAKRVDWVNENPALLKYGDENIDPFSFFYFLAQKNTANQRDSVYASVSNVFEIEKPLPDFADEYQWIFPTPLPIAPALFHNNGVGNPDLLWQLFRQAVSSNPNINSDDFKNVLNIGKVGVAKLTQCLFLMNPSYFMPVDSGIFEFYRALNLPPFSEAENKIQQQNGWQYYKEILNKFGDSFPQCRPYEINAALFLMGKWEEKKTPIGKNFFQISTNVYNNDVDQWTEFAENNHVFTGGPGDGSGGWNSYKPNQPSTQGQPYPLEYSKQGDIILVRYGRRNGRAIGIVYKNDYAEKGLNDKGAIHVLWLNKLSDGLAGNTPIIGFSYSPDSSKTYRAFADTDSYKPTFQLIDYLCGKSKDNEGNQSNDSKMIHPLNQILYGPPGTGKTWNTVYHALAIIEGTPIEELQKDRTSAKQRFDKLKESGKIEMVTFHQNFSYEDFIEGIKPVLGDASGNVTYEIVDGVFKAISNRANKNLTESLQEPEEFDLDALLQDFAQHISDKIAQGETIELYPETSSPTLLAGVKLLKNGGIQFHLILGNIKQDYHVSANVILRDYRKFISGEIKKYQDIKPTYKSKSLCHGDASRLFPLMQKIKTYQKNEWQPVEQAPATKQNYVLIIDEINRGNIAKIFGELITLIEDGKRIGNNDEMTVTLPYSSGSDDNGRFGVPNNLYIIGTMNTADRSIALLDTALRRRFDFIEMMPQPNHQDISNDVDGVDCQELLKVMNKRITALLDREHQIGHSYFIGVDSMQNLASVSQHKIVPLLQEYFYDDWAKIDLVLNKNKFVISAKMTDDLFSNTELVDSERLIYELIKTKSPEWTKPENYKKIYAGTQKQSDDNDGG